MRITGLTTIRVFMVMMNPLTLHLGNFSEVPVHKHTAAWRINKNWKSMCSCKAIISLQLQRYGRIAHMTGIMSCMAVNFLERTGQRGKVVELIFI